MASGVYIQFLEDMFTAGLNVTANSVYCALMTASHAFTASNYGWSAISANEIAMAGYTHNGVALTGASITTGATTYWDAADVTWSSVTISASNAVLFSSPNEVLIASIDFGGLKSSSSGDFKIQWNASGIITLAE